MEIREVPDTYENKRLGEAYRGAMVALLGGESLPDNELFNYFSQTLRRNIDEFGVDVVTAAILFDQVPKLKGKGTSLEVYEPSSGLFIVNIDRDDFLELDLSFHATPQAVAIFVKDGIGFVIYPEIEGLGDRVAASRRLENELHECAHVVYQICLSVVHAESNILEHIYDDYRSEFLSHLLGNRTFFGYSKTFQKERDYLEGHEREIVEKINNIREVIEYSRTKHIDQEELDTLVGIVLKSRDLEDMTKKTKAFLETLRERQGAIGWSSV